MTPDDGACGRFAETDGSWAPPLARDHLDRVLVQDVHFAFGQALDENDWALYRSCLDEQVHVDYSQSAGLPPTTTSADAWTAFARACVEPQTTMHYYTNLRILFTGPDHATTRLNHQSHHRVEAADRVGLNVQFGTYRTEAVRRDGRWRLSAIEHRTAWITGDPGLLDVSAPAWVLAHSAVFGR